MALALEVSLRHQEGGRSSTHFRAENTKQGWKGMTKNRSSKICTS